MGENNTKIKFEELLSEISQKYDIPQNLRENIIKNKDVIEKSLLSLSADEIIKASKEVQNGKFNWKYFGNNSIEYL